MTPEDLKMRDLYHSVIVMSSTRQAIDALRAAIQAAVAEERAACAKAVLGCHITHTCYGEDGDECSCALDAAAAAIRARG